MKQKKVFFLISTLFMSNLVASDKCQQCSERRQKIIQHFFTIIISAVAAVTQKDNRTQLSQALGDILQNISNFIQCLVSKTKNVNESHVTEALDELEHLAKDEYFLCALKQEITQFLSSHGHEYIDQPSVKFDENCQMIIA